MTDYEDQPYHETQLKKALRERDVANSELLRTREQIRQFTEKWVRDSRTDRRIHGVKMVESYVIPCVDWIDAFDHLTSALTDRRSK